jgi:chemotaxis protein CheX
VDRLRVEYINPFVQAAFSVLKMTASKEVSRGELSLKGKAFLTQPITVAAGVVGSIEGTVFYSMEIDVALGIAGAMMGGEPLAEFDELARSAIAELSNMITGNAATILAESGLPCDISPPTVLEGRAMRVTTVDRTLCIPVVTDHGGMEIIVGLEEARAKGGG